MCVCVSVVGACEFVCVSVSVVGACEFLCLCMCICVISFMFECVYVIVRFECVSVDVV